MSYGTSLGITLPTVGTTAGPTWATDLNTAIQDVIDVLETKVTPAGMDINADLSFRSSGTSYRAKDLKAVSLTNQDSTLAAATYPSTLFSTDVDGELYYNDNNGRQVQVTSDGAVNVSTSGGITGSGYGSTSVEVNWDSANMQYKLRSGSGADDYADVLCRDLKLNDGSANTLTVSAPALAADYTLTLPNAVPAASNSLLEMDTSGNVTTTKTPSVTTVTTSGALAVGGGTRLGAIQSYSGAQTITTADSMIFWTGTTAGANRILTLPASPATGQVLFIVFVGGTGALTLARNGKNINGAASDLSGVTGDKFLLVYTGSEWYSIVQP